MRDSLVLIVNSNGGYTCPVPKPRSGLGPRTVDWKEAIWQEPPPCHPGAEAGEALFSACPSAILPALGLLARSRLAGSQFGLVCLACEVTFYVYFGFVLILSSQHCFSHRGKSKHSLHLPAPPSSARASWSIINL